jgi:hypothetical protein
MAYLYLLAVIFVLYLMMQNKTRGMNKAIEKLVRQSARYAVAAQQDASPVIAVLHANYAAAYFYALKEFASEFTNPQRHWYRCQQVQGTCDECSRYGDPKNFGKVSRICW